MVGLTVVCPQGTKRFLSGLSDSESVASICHQYFDDQAYSFIAGGKLLRCDDVIPSSVTRVTLVLSVKVPTFVWLCVR
jgi:hypothetical protein